MDARIVTTLLVMLLLSTVHAQRQQELELEAADRVKVFGAFYPTQKESPAFCCFTKPRRTAGSTRTLHPA